MLKLTKKADYGLIALKHLAVKKSSASAKEMADAYQIPLPLLSKVLQKLGKNGFLLSEHGTNGGDPLGRPARGDTGAGGGPAVYGSSFFYVFFFGQCGRKQTERRTGPGAF